MDYRKESKKEQTAGYPLYLLPYLLYVVFLTKYFIPPIKFPTPLMVINAFYELLFTVLNHIGATMFRVLTGFLVGSIAGIGFGLFMGLNPSVNKYLNPLVESSRPVPPIATIPFFILWFGIGDLGKILLIIVGCALVMIVNTVEAIRNVPPIYVKAAQTLGARNNSIYKTIIMPAIIPHIIAGLRVASALSFSLAIAAEYMGAQSGIGYVVMLARRTLKTENIMLGILLLGILSSLLDTGIRLVGNYLTRWSERLPS